MPRLFDPEGDDLGEIVSVELTEHMDDDGHAQDFYSVVVNSPERQT